MGEYRNQAMDNLLGAVADSTRRAILARLATGDARVTEVAAEFPISLNSVSKHVRMLERAGLVRRTVRGRDHVLSLDAAPLADAAAVDRPLPALLGRPPGSPRQIRHG